MEPRENCSQMAKMTKNWVEFNKNNEKKKTNDQICSAAPAAKNTRSPSKVLIFRQTVVLEKTYQVKTVKLEKLIS